MCCITFNISHLEKSVSSNSALEIFDSDHQAITYRNIFVTLAKRELHALGTKGTGWAIYGESISLGNKFLGPFFSFSFALKCM